MPNFAARRCRASRTTLIGSPLSGRMTNVPPVCATFFFSSPPQILSMAFHKSVITHHRKGFTFTAKFKSYCHRHPLLLTSPSGHSAMFCCRKWKSRHVILHTIPTITATIASLRYPYRKNLPNGQARRVQPTRLDTPRAPKSCNLNGRLFKLSADFPSLL